MYDIDGQSVPTVSVARICRGVVLSTYMPFWIEHL
jgi:hypothetical protein